MAGISSISTLVNTPAKRQKLQQQWLRSLTNNAARAQHGSLGAEELGKRAEEFLQLLSEATKSGSADIESAGYKPLREFLEQLSRSRAQHGFSSSETASFIFSFKQSLFEQLRAERGADSAGLADDIWTGTQLLDALGLHTVAAYQSGRDAIIRRQQEEMLELSTPVVKLWDGILALPMIGTLDSARTQIVMESLLQKIVDTESQIATLDTLVAQHLLKTVTALRLMGAECIISGVRPQIAQTIVHLGVDLQGVITKASLADALALAMKRIGVTFVKQ